MFNNSMRKLKALFTSGWLREGKENSVRVKWNLNKVIMYLKVRFFCKEKDITKILLIANTPNLAYIFSIGQPIKAQSCKLW